MSSSLVSFLILIVSFSSVVLSDPSSLHKLEIPGRRIGPEGLAFDPTGKVFYASVSGGKILKYTSETGFVDFAQTSQDANKPMCDGALDKTLNEKCGRPTGMALNKRTGELYILDAVLGLHVVSLADGLSKKIADPIDEKTFNFLEGLDVDDTTSVIYFTSFGVEMTMGEVLTDVTVKNGTSKLFKYDPKTKRVTVLIEALGGLVGCAVSADGSFVLVSEFRNSKIQRYWIKGLKAGKTEELTTNITFPYHINRVGSSGNFWVASTSNETTLVNPSVVTIDSEGKVLQTVSLKAQLKNDLLNEVNEFNSSLYVGVSTGKFVGVLKL